MADSVRRDFSQERCGEGKNYQLPGEGVVYRTDKQRAWGDVNEREHLIDKTRLKKGHLKHLYEETTQTLSGKGVC